MDLSFGVLIDISLASARCGNGSIGRLRLRDEIPARSVGSVTRSSTSVTATNEMCVVLD
jgi:hypothetical protein